MEIGYGVPAMSAPPANEALPTPGVGVVAKPRVLVVEDDPLIRRTYDRVLASGYDITACATGDEALNALRTDRFDAVVSDIDVPGLTGIELLKSVRATDLDVPVVLVTGSPSIESAQDAVNYGAFSYLTKPVAPSALRDVVGRAVKVRELLALQREAGLASGQSFSDRAGQEARFESALSSLWMAFQPIVSVGEHKVIGYEALLRTDESTLARPPDLLDVAERLGRLHELGRAARRAVARAIESGPRDVRFFVNLHPRDLADPELYAPDSPLAAHASRVVLEVTERASLEEVDGLTDRIAELRRLGYWLAIDDLGAGYAGLTSLTRLEPEVVKLDMGLVRGITESRTKQQLVSSMVHVCKELGMTVVTEGVENDTERDVLVGLGCDLLQGYFYARPQRGFVVPAC